VSGAGVLAAFAGLCTAAGVVELLQARAIRIRARAADGDPVPPRRPLTALLIKLGSGAGLRVPADLATRLEAAGLDGTRAPDLMAAKVGAAMVGALLALLLGGSLPGRLGLLALVAAPAGAFLAPDEVLRRRTRTRADALARELPDTLDLLRVAVQAGLSPGRALNEVGQRANGLLASELRDAARRMALGQSTEAVLTRLALRCPVPAVAMLVAATRRAGRHGAPLAPALAALATDARAERARVLREQAAKAAPKIQLIVALALVPGVLLLVAAVLIPRVA
jgi:tight adherence protein C